MMSDPEKDSPTLMRAVSHLRSIARAAPRHPVVSLICATVIASGFFLLFPGVDLWVSGLFFDPASGNFPAASNEVLKRLRSLGPYLVWLIALGSVLILVVKVIWPEQPPLVPLGKPLFLLITLALGPGLLANGILKAHSGRPRPRNVDVFGGDLPYVDVWRFTDHCKSNCSFVSGEGSSGAWLLALALVLPLAWRKPALWATATIGVLVSVNRVAFGGHFLSDTVLAWTLNGLLIALFYHLFFIWQPAWVTPSSLDAAFSRIGFSLQDRFAYLDARVRRFKRAHKKTE